MWILLLGGCHWTPEVTDHHGMVGRILDPKGMPVGGLAIESLEARAVTDEEGRFAVEYKPPDELVHFSWKGTWYQRTYQEGDDQKVVDVRLPEIRDADLVCGLEAPCDLELVWDLGEGLTAKVNAACTPGSQAKLLSIPRGAPTITCRDGVGSKAFVLEDRVDTVEILPPAGPVRVEIREEEGRLPADCTVQIGRREAVKAGEGFWTAEATGTVTVSALCEGRPAVPRTIRAGAGEVVLDWSPTGPELDLAGMPLANEMWLVRDGSPEDLGWMIRIVAAEDGRFQLPPLAAGAYRVAVGDPGNLATMTPPSEPVPPGLLKVLAVSPGDGTSPGGLVAMMRLEEDVVEGQIPVSGLQ